VATEPQPPLHGWSVTSEWASMHIHRAHSLGLIPHSLFAASPTFTDYTLPATRAEIDGQPLPQHASTFADNAQISSWAVDVVGQTQASEIMGGIGNNMFAPQGDYTREQSIVTILRLFEKLSPNFDELTLEDGSEVRHFVAHDDLRHHSSFRITNEELEELTYNTFLDLLTISGFTFESGHLYDVGDTPTGLKVIYIGDERITIRCPSIEHPFDDGWLSPEITWVSEYLWSNEESFLIAVYSGDDNRIINFGSSLFQVGKRKSSPPASR